MNEHHRVRTVWERTIRGGWWYLPLIGWGFPQLVPLLDKRHHVRVPPPIRALGVALALLGGALTGWSIRTLIRDGNGTPAPHDPPQTFVCSGPYAHCRNPMELGNIVTLIGWSIVQGSPRRAVGALLFAISIHAWIVLIEEPYLQRHFDPDYTRYRSRVPRWGWRHGDAEIP